MRPTDRQGEGRDLRERLRALRDDAPDGGFAASLHRRLVEAGPPAPPPLWRRLVSGLQGEQRFLWLVTASACAVALVLALGSLRGGTRPAAAAAAQLPATKVAVVRVNLSAEVAVEAADIRVSLPDGLVFWADGQELAQRSFEWSQPLRAGDNDIPIAVRGLRPGQYRMTVTALFGKERVEEDVLLEVTDG
jgi:hypothetical protein